MRRVKVKIRATCLGERLGGVRLTRPRTPCLERQSRPLPRLLPWPPLRCWTPTESGHPCLRPPLGCSSSNSDHPHADHTRAIPHEKTHHSRTEISLYYPNGLLPITVAEADKAPAFASIPLPTCLGTQYARTRRGRTRLRQER